MLALKTTIFLAPLNTRALKPKLQLIDVKPDHKIGYLDSAYFPVTVVVVTPARPVFMTTWQSGISLQDCLTGNS